MWIIPKSGATMLAANVFPALTQTTHTFDDAAKFAVFLCKGGDGARSGGTWNAAYGAIIQASLRVDSANFPTSREIDLEVARRGASLGVGGDYTGGAGGGHAGHSYAIGGGGGGATIILRTSDQHPLIVAGGGGGNSRYFGSPVAGGNGGIASTSWLGTSPSTNPGSGFTGGAGTYQSSTEGNDGGGGGGGGGGGPSGSGRSPGAGGIVKGGGGGGDSWVDETLLTVVASYWSNAHPSVGSIQSPSDGFVMLLEFDAEFQL